MPIQHSSTLRAKRKLGIARAGSGKLLACALAIVALILCLYKYHQAGRRTIFAAELQESDFQAALFHKAADQHQDTLDHLQKQVLTVQRQYQELDARSSCISKANSVWRPLPPIGNQPNSARHRAAVLVPYRDRAKQLVSFLPQLISFLKAQGQQHDVFVIEQSPLLHFNRGALLNAGVLLLQASEYDYFIFHDVDTIPTEAGNISYAFPDGPRPMHLTPPEIHPKNIRYQDFFGGSAAFSTEQIYAVNGFGTNFWGWGREDDNMRQRLMQAGRWPPQKPPYEKRRGRQFYFKHSAHPKAPEVRMKKGKDGSIEYVAVNPDKPFKDALIVSSQPDNFLDFETGLNTTAFTIASVQAIDNLAVKYTVALYCDRERTPWCS